MRRRGFRLAGRACFGGGPAVVIVTPGRAGAGWRWAVGGKPMRPMTPEDHVPLPHRSTLGGRATMPEHLLAALVMLDVDDIDLRFAHGEAPLLDGSALPWVRALRAAGFRPKPPGLQVDVSFHGTTVSWSGGTGPAGARTFIDADEARAVRHLFPGARPGDAVVFRDGGALYGGRPRMADEPAWHKLLDVLGDLGPWRARGRLTGSIERIDPGHASNGETLARDLRDGRLHWAP
ncbi:MAG: UDP-3-O-acyl-N-acetylglucosamine deacetylase [Proteobacteria bacterium]|nr:UDP-3-O-acyl-N-acetylglucosamine deacetylase [Pseudomonadota bacterium]